MKITLFALIVCLFAALYSAFTGNISYAVFNIGLVIVNAMFLRRDK